VKLSILLCTLLFPAHPPEAEADLSAMKLDPVRQRAYFVNLATAWLINKTMN
jgi:hypothetical protein